MIAVWRAFLAALVWSVLASDVNAKTITIPKENVSIDIPDSWNQVTRPGVLFSAGDATNTSILTIAVFSNSENRGIQPPYIAGIKGTMISQGQKFGGTTQILKEGPLTIGGAPAYQIEGRTDLPQAQTVTIFQYPIFANRKTYVVALQTYDADQNSEMEAIARSFRFSTPPVLPDASENSSPQVIAIPGEDLTITIPPDWTHVDMEGNLFFAKDATYTSTVSLKAYPDPENQDRAQTFLENVKKISSVGGFLAGATFTYNHEGPATAAGVPGYFIRGTATVGQTEKDYVCTYAFAANHKLYQLALQTGDPAQMPVVENIARSLQFGHPPELPEAPTPSDYERGFRMGQTLFYVFFGGAVLLVISAAGFFVYRFAIKH